MSMICIVLRLHSHPANTSNWASSSEDGARESGFGVRQWKVFCRLLSHGRSIFPFQQWRRERGEDENCLQALTVHRSPWHLSTISSLDSSQLCDIFLQAAEVLQRNNRQSLGHAHRDNSLDQRPQEPPTNLLHQVDRILADICLDGPFLASSSSDCNPMGPGEEERDQRRRWRQQLLA